MEHDKVQGMRLHVWLTDEQNEAVLARSEALSITRSEWVRRAVESILGAPEGSWGADSDTDVGAVEEQLRAQWITEKTMLLDRITELEQSRNDSTLQIALIGKDLKHGQEVKNLLDDQVRGLKSQVSNYEGQFAYLTTVQSRVIEEKQVPESNDSQSHKDRRWWRFW